MKVVETEDNVVGFLKKLVIIHGIVFVLCSVKLQKMCTHQNDQSKCSPIYIPMTQNPEAQPWTVRGLVGVSRSRSETRA